MTPRPPQQDDHVPIDGQGSTFHGTNPWSGPYFVIAVLVMTLLIVGGLVLASMMNSA
jgi:hypothetical protein